MKLKQNASVEKLAGRYYTPYPLAEFIVQWGMQDNNVTQVLEPSCGDGVFLEALRQIDMNFHCSAIEIFKEEAEIANNRLLLDNRFEIIIADFYDMYINNLQNSKYQFIMGNPPYIRYQYLTEAQRERQSLILTNNGLAANKLINAWVAFVTATVHLLDDNSKIGFVIPAELLQVKYSEQLRMYLMRELQEITIITFKELIFPDVEQEVVVLLGVKNANYTETHKMKILEFNNINDLINNFYEVNREQDFQHIDMSTNKWTKYFLSTQENECLTLIETDNNFIRFGDIASVDVGITTGNNTFFCVDHNTALEYDLIEISKPLIARSVNIPGVTFMEQDWQENVRRGSKTYLIDFNNIPKENMTQKQLQYIAQGEATEQHLGYKCSIRKRWYDIPSIWAPDAFFLRRNYQYPKFVLNYNNTLSTDTMHRIKFKLVDNSKKAILAYYNSVAFAYTELEARSYGGGVLEILPRELENVKIPNIIDLAIDEAVVDMLFDYLDTTIRNERNIEEALDLIDTVILIEHMNLNEAMVRSFRQIWHKLKDRRISRGVKE